MAKVLNKFDGHRPSPTAIYVGRPSKFGNPYSIGKDGCRELVIAKFELYFWANLELQETVLKELPGKDLICWCAPLACHADILLEFANRKAQ